MTVLWAGTRSFPVVLSVAPIVSVDLKESSCMAIVDPIAMHEDSLVVPKHKACSPKD